MVSHGLYGTLWMVLCFGPFLTEELQIPEQIGAEGGSVVFTPENLPTSINLIQWYFGTNFILSAQSGEPIIDQGYKDRISFNRDTLALELRDLTLDDSGKYILTVIPTTGDTFKEETSLQVFENITNVRVTGPEELLIEGESSANLISEGTGSISSVQWMKDNSPLSPSNNIIFSSDNRSVSISPVQRSDSGEYQCTYRNPFSSETAKLSLTVNYGPEDVSVVGQHVVDLGVHVSLSCSANSEPSASFSWKFNETDTNVTTDTFTINQTDFTHSGDYNCTASNKVTKRSVSQKHALLVKEGGEVEAAGRGLTSGEIAGIVIGVLVAVAGICGLIVYLTKIIPKLNLQKRRQSGAAQSRQDIRAEIIPGMNEHTYQNVVKVNVYENNVYENEKPEFSRRPRAPTPPQV
ncbi:carcinoembryonic antigen-related cell adhesion molecule 20-like [Puntigrus tetrazona]|uniref:carcinoembryonic antigen-related cell adhesion molecule 20-like n=1 Tax=Puntigrus tetrazona TaxID=1606681 RepID=UPI001C895C7C|nr:carcinoembryonic antigen-related cell adhesion molecule 20-like [Puntigrus tetrazona]